MSIRREASDSLGRCPLCGQSLPRYSHLISYRRDGWPTMYAECDDCEEIVHPE